jgi:Tfp pilus assembly protein PilN
MHLTTIAAEWDDRALRVLVVRGAARRARVVRQDTLALADDSAAALGQALRGVLATTPARRPELRLAMRHRQVTCGEMALQGAVPRGAELMARVTAHAHKLGVYAENEPLVVGFRARAGAPFDAALCAAPRSLLDDVHAEVNALTWSRWSLVPSEVVLGAAVGTAAEPTALLEVHGSRAVLVLAARGRARAVRRFKLPLPYSAAPDNGAELAPLLLGEVTRSLAYFRDQGKGDAHSVAVAGDLPADTALVPELAELLAPLPVSVVALPPFADLTAAPLAHLVPALLLARGVNDLPCLVEPARTRRARITAIAALQAAGIASLVFGVDLLVAAHSPATFRLRAEIAGARASQEALAAEVESLRAALREGPAVRARADILARLDQGAAARSALLATLAHARPQALLFHKIELADDGALALTGVARTADRLLALTALAELESVLRDLPGFGRGRGALGEAAGDGQIAFRFTAHLAGSQP